MNVNFKKISFIPFFIIIFYKTFIKFNYIFTQLKFFYSKLLLHCSTVQFIYIPIFQIHRFVIFIIILYILGINFRIYRWIAWHIPFLITLSTFTNISISVGTSNLTLVFFKAPRYASPDAVGKQTWSTLHILDTSFENFQTHQLAKYIALNIQIMIFSSISYSKTFTHSFPVRLISFSNIFHVKVTMKIFFFTWCCSTFLYLYWLSSNILVSIEDFSILQNSLFSDTFLCDLSLVFVLSFWCYSYY